MTVERKQKANFDSKQRRSHLTRVDPQSFKHYDHAINSAFEGQPKNEEPRLDQPEETNRYSLSIHSRSLASDRVTPCGCATPLGQALSEDVGPRYIRKNCGA